MAQCSVIYELTFYIFMLLLIENQWFYFFDYLLAYSERNFSVTIPTVVEYNLINASRLVFLLLLTIHVCITLYIYNIKIIQ